MATEARTGMVRVAHIMGMPISLDIADDLPPQELERLSDLAFDWLREVDEQFSTYRPDSEISRLARGELTTPSPLVASVLERCEELRAETDGWFDAFAGGPLDPSGLVKGWAVQEASDRLTAAGCRNHCVNAGGDIALRGGPSPGQPWRIGIRHPWQPMALSWVLACTDLAVATSGTYERGAHIIDPFTRLPATDLVSVTVVGPDLGTADAYATAALAMGLAGLDWLAGLDGHESAAVTSDGRAFRSDGLPVAAAP